MSHSHLLICTEIALIDHSVQLLTASDSGCVNYALSHSTSAAGVKRRTYFLYFQKKLNQYSLLEFLI